jgi:hypothetical protein
METPSTSPERLSACLKSCPQLICEGPLGQETDCLLRVHETAAQPNMYLIQRSPPVKLQR